MIRDSFDVGTINDLNEKLTKIIEKVILYPIIIKSI